MVKQLPKDWKWVKLGEVLSVSSGKGIKVNSLQGGKYAVYGGNGLNGYHSEYLLEESKLIIGRVGVKCGVMHITKPKSWVTDNALIVEPKNNAFDIQFLKMKLGFENLNKLSVSTAQPVISGSKIYAYEILLPPKSTQLAIVCKIEELFSELDKGIENLRMAQQQLKTYRQSVLKWAFEEIENESKVEDITESLLIGLVRSSKDQNDDSVGVPYVKMNNIDLNGNVDFSELVFVAANSSEIERFHLKKGDILINTRNSFELVGKTGIVREEKTNAVFNNNILRIRVKSNFLPLFIAYQLINPSLKGQMLKEKKATTNVCAIYLRDILPLKVKVCGIEEQNNIVQEIESRLSVADKMEENITQSLQKAEALRQSILKMAFEGRLV